MGLYGKPKLSVLGAEGGCESVMKAAPGSYFLVLKRQHLIHSANRQMVRTHHLQATKAEFLWTTLGKITKTIFTVFSL